MRERRFFVEILDVPTIELDEHESHHAVHVLRLGAGDAISLFDGHGRAHRGRILHTRGARVTVEVGAALPSNESPLRLSLAIAVPKGDVMSRIVQKLTELGVYEIRPLVSEHTDPARAGTAKRLERWQRVALEAAKQCGRSAVPVLSPPLDLEELLAAAPDRRFWMAHPDATPLTPERLADERQPTVIIGPEGGWSPRELELAQAAAVERFALGPRTLRVDTAAITSASLFQWLAGDLDRR